MKHKLLCLLVLFALLLPVCVSAQDTKISDEAGLLTSSEIKHLESRARQIADTYQMDVAIVTVNTTGSSTTAHYSDRYYDDHGYGYGSDRSGVLLLLCMDDRSWSICTTGSARSAVTDDDTYEIINSISWELQNDRYYDAFSAYLSILEEYYEDSLPNYPLRIGISMLIGLLVGFIVLSVLKSKMNTFRSKKDANDYMVPGSYNLFLCQDFFLYSHTSRTPKSNNSGSHGSGGHSGGHGGGSGHF